MLILPNYQITEQIYESVNSIVYRGIKNRDKKPVILKMLKQDYPTPAELTRYQQEYEITHDLDVTGVIKTYGIEKYQNTLIIILEDFGGESLKQVMINRQFTITEFLAFAIQITDILGNIHTENIIHKDINPSNIIINPKTKELKIIDFGIASRLPRENSTLKNPEHLEGTLAYLAPEQTGRINRDIDYRSDLYSLGITFYEILTGELPFNSTDAMELVHCHIAKMPTPLYEINPNIPLIISDIVVKLLAKNAEDRYQSAFGLKLDFEKLQDFEKFDGVKFKLAQYNFSGRFQIPQKLYGREDEVNTLLQTFERVINGSTEMMLVAGYSGVGKSALVHEVHKPMTEKRGYFADGKFDQFQKNIPYSAITQAFNKFCRYLLLENNLIEQQLLSAVGNNGQIIIDVIPDLELVIGKQPPVAEVGPTEAQNRFQMVFLNFIKALCSAEHPFILFIDDLQWVDSASLALLKTIMLDDEIRHLLIIGAYRDNEVDKNHPFIMAVDSLTTVQINTIKLKNLQLSNVNHLLQDTLQCETGKSQKLAGLVYQKTQGNAFFIRQFLQSLYTNELLYFQKHKWHWNIKQIKKQNITANVVELMVEQLQKLPKIAQQVLRLAACVGNQFDLNILAIIHERSQLATVQDLSSAIQTGLILPTSELEVIDGQLAAISYKFLHDRVQQAAYSLIDDEQKKTVHLKIGQLLLANLSEENIFNIANQLNNGVNLINKLEDKLELAEINLQASQKAKQSMASQPALEYIKQAVDLLPENPWQYQLTLQIYKQYAEIEFINLHYDMAEQLIHEVIEQATNITDKVDMYYLLITMHGVKGDFNQAIEAGREALTLFEIILPNEDEKEQASTQEMELARDNLRGIKPESILNWHDMDDANSVMIIKLLVALEPPVYIIGDLSTYVYLVSRAINISVKHRGLVAEISKIYANYGFLIGDIYVDYVSSYKFGVVALKIAERYNSGTYICKSSLLFGNWINPWCRPINQAAAIHSRGYQAGIEAGEYEFAGYNIYGYFNNLFTQGKNITEINNEIELYLPLVEKINHQFAGYFSFGISYIINVLQDEVLLQKFLANQYSK